MAIEIRIKRVKDGVTVSITGPELGDAGDGGSGNKDDTGTGGSGNKDDTGTGGSGNKDDPGTGGGAPGSGPVVVIGPIVICDSEDDLETVVIGPIVVDGSGSAKTVSPVKPVKPVKPGVPLSRRFEAEQLPFTMDKQGEHNWCWAAVAVSVNRLLSGLPESDFTQCAVALPVLTKMEGAVEVSDCCAKPELCNLPAKLQDALHVVGNLKQTRKGPLDFAAIKDELDSKPPRPVAARIGWPDGGGHFIAIVGYREFTSGDPLVQVADPLHGTSPVDAPALVLYDELVNAYDGDGTWTDTFLLKA